jgi:acyl-CoA thioesterase I
MSTSLHRVNASRRIVVLGDSLGTWPTMAESFPSVLQTNVVAEQLPWTIVNASRSGDTTAGGAARVGRLLDAEVSILVVALGANDGLRGISLTVVETNLVHIIQAAQRRRIQVLLCGMEAPPVYGWPYMLGFHNLFPSLASRLGIPFVPFLLEGVALVPSMNSADRIHPNAAGAQRIAETVWRYLRPLLTSAESTVM